MTKPDEASERRRLFFSVMRRPEMRLVRRAFWALKWDKGAPWESIQELEILPSTEASPWMLLTDRHAVIQCPDGDFTIVGRDE